jgi:IS4 transposase
MLQEIRYSGGRRPARKTSKQRHERGINPPRNRPTSRLKLGWFTRWGQQMDRLDWMLYKLKLERAEVAALQNREYSGPQLLGLKNDSWWLSGRVSELEGKTKAAAGLRA